jgi:hypothetical protein
MSPPGLFAVKCSRMISGPHFGVTVEGETDSININPDRFRSYRADESPHLPHPTRRTYARFLVFSAGIVADREGEQRAQAV